MIRFIALQRRLEKLLQRGFFGNAAWMFAGAILGQGSIVIAAPFLTRLYTSAEFGTLDVFSVVLFPFSSVATVRYEMAVILAEITPELLGLLLVSGGKKTRHESTIA